MLDLIVLAVLVILTIWGWRVGLLHALLGALSTVLALILGALIYQPVCKLLAGTGLEARIGEKVSAVLAARAAETGTLELPAFLQSFLEGTVGAAQDSIAASVTMLVMQIISFVLVVIAAKLLLALLFAILKVTARLPILKQANGLLGAVLGLAIGFVIVYGALALLTVYLSTRPAPAFDALLAKSVVAQHLYHNNLILNWLLR